MRQLALALDALPSRAPSRRGAVETSEQAARMVDRVLTGLQRAVLEAYREHGDMTADECARVLRRSVLSIRPRVCELARAGELRDTKHRRANDSGRAAAVWTIAQERA